MIASFQPDSSPALKALAAGGIVAGAAMLLYSGRLDSSDEQMMAATARSLATAGSLTFPEMYGQTFTGYGVGTPLTGVPFVWLDLLLGGAMGPPPLVLLANALLLGAAVMMGIVVCNSLKTRSKWIPWIFLGVTLSSPALPLATRYYSDVLAGVGILAMATGILTSPRGSGRWAGALAASGAAFALMARPSMLPLLLLVLAWGFRFHRSIPRLISSIIGISAGLGVRAIQNFLLRGSPFAQGYDGQEFTTPLVTGLHGLLFSPERGLLVFWPVVLVLLIPVRGENSEARRWRLLSMGAIATAAVLHGGFWTWHGGWTVGPRFLLPAVMLAMPSVVLGVRAIFTSKELWLRLSGLMLFLWGAFINLLHTAFHAPDAYNLAWNFHREESRFLFEPQMGLMRWWGVLAVDGAWYPMALRWMAGSGGIERDGLLALGVGVALVIGCGVLLWRCEEVRPSEILKRLSGLFGTRSHPIPWAGAGSLVLLLVVAGAFRGDRGLESDAGESYRFARVHRVPPGEVVRLVGLLDLAPHGEYVFQGRVQGAYRFEIDGVVVSDSRDAEADRHLFAGGFTQTESGLRLLEIELVAPAEREGMFELYWTWPGEGRLQEAVGGEYVLPRSLTGAEAVATRIWRQRWILLVFGVFVLVLGSGGYKPRATA